MKKSYISPDVDVLLFLSLEQLATEPEQLNADGTSTSEPVPDVTIPGPQIPGWGN